VLLAAAHRAYSVCPCLPRRRRIGVLIMGCYLVYDVQAISGKFTLSYEVGKQTLAGASSSCRCAL